MAEVGQAYQSCTGAGETPRVIRETGGGHERGMRSLSRLQYNDL